MVGGSVALDLTPQVGPGWFHASSAAVNFAVAVMVAAAVHLAVDGTYLHGFQQHDPIWFGLPLLCFVRIFEVQRLLAKMFYMRQPVLVLQHLVNRAHGPWQR